MHYVTIIKWEPGAPGIIYPSVSDVDTAILTDNTPEIFPPENFNLSIFTNWANLRNQLGVASENDTNFLVYVRNEALGITYSMTVFVDEQSRLDFNQRYQTMLAELDVARSDFINLLGITILERDGTIEVPEEIILYGQATFEQLETIFVSLV